MELQEESIHITFPFMTLKTREVCRLYERTTTQLPPIRVSLVDIHTSHTSPFGARPSSQVPVKPVVPYCLNPDLF